MDIKQIQAAINEMHSLNLRGNDYTQVQQRLEAFRKHAGTSYTLDSEILINDGKTILIRASILDKEGRVIATGLAEELRGSSNVNKTSAIENCETSAWGRALANLGLHGGKMASVEEIKIAKNKEKQIDAKAQEAKAEAEHDAAVRQEQNSEPSSTPQQLKELIDDKIKKATETWHLKNIPKEHSADFNVIKKHDAKMSAELNAYYKTRWDQLNTGER